MFFTRYVFMKNKVIGEKNEFQNKLQLQPYCAEPTIWVMTLTYCDCFFFTKSLPIYATTTSMIHIDARVARWPSGSASDSGARGWGFDTYLPPVVSLGKDTFTPQKVLVIHRKRWLRPDMSEKTFTGTLNLIKPNKPLTLDVIYTFCVFVAMKLHLFYLSYRRIRFC